MFDGYLWSISEMEDRYNERLREAERYWLAREFSLAEPRDRLADRALAAFGHKLAEWGKHLEERHAVSRTPAGAIQPAAQRSPAVEIVSAPRPEPMVALDLSGAAHKHMNLYSHSHRG